MKDLVQEFLFILLNIHEFKTKKEYLEKEISIYYYFISKVTVYKENGGDMKMLESEILKGLNDIEKDSLSDRQFDFIGDILDDISGNSNSL